VNVIGNFFWNIVLPMINWKAGISMMILSFDAALHYYSISDMLLTSGNLMKTNVSNTMLERSESVMINMLKLPEQIKSQILECAQILNYPFRHVWLFEWLILNKHCTLKTMKLTWIFYLNGMCCIVRAVIFILSP
jgi:hypothetical protein